MAAVALPAVVLGRTPAALRAADADVEVTDDLADVLARVHESERTTDTFQRMGRAARRSRWSERFRPLAPRRGADRAGIRSRAS